MYLLLNLLAAGICTTTQTNADTLNWSSVKENKKIMFNPGKQILQIKELINSEEEFGLRDLTLSVKGDFEQFNEINFLISWKLKYLENHKIVFVDEYCMSDEPDLYKYENLISEEAKIVCFDAPADQVQIWQFEFSKKEVIITCNKETLLDYEVSQALTPEDSGQCMEDKIKEKWAVLWDNKQVVELEFNSLMFSSDSRYKILSKYFIKPSKLGVT